MSRPTLFSHKRLLQLDDELKQQIDDFRFARRFKTEADAIRELIRLGLEAAKGGKKN